MMPGPVIELADKLIEQTLGDPGFEITLTKSPFCDRQYKVQIGDGEAYYGVDLEKCVAAAIESARQGMKGEAL